MALNLKKVVFYSVLILPMFLVGGVLSDEFCTGLLGTCHHWGPDDPLYEGTCCIVLDAKFELREYPPEGSHNTLIPLENVYCGMLESTKTYTPGYPVCYLPIGECGEPMYSDNCFSI